VDLLVLDHARSVIAPPEAGGSRAGRAAAPWAVVAAGAVLGLSEEAARRSAKVAPRMIAWSGTLAAEPFGDDPRTWGPAGWAALGEACERLAPVLHNEGAVLVLRTHARHVLSDVPSCIRFVRERRARDGEAGPLRVLLDPASMIAESMRDLAEDHLRRIAEAIPLLGHGLAGVVVGCVGGTPGADAGVVARLVQAHAPPGLPIIVEAGDLAAVGAVVSPGGAPA
jgi:hypothetical protein